MPSGSRLGRPNYAMTNQSHLIEQPRLQPQRALSAGQYRCWTTRPPSFPRTRVGRKFREEALPSIVPRNTKTLGFPGPSLSSGGRIRTCDLRVMSPTSYQTAPPRVAPHVLANIAPSENPWASFRAQCAQRLPLLLPANAPAAAAARAARPNNTTAPKSPNDRPSTPANCRASRVASTIPLCARRSST